MSCCSCVEASETAGDIAQAFSWFTLAESRGALVVCDIQGVGLCFTDPQVHSADGEGFGGLYLLCARLEAPQDLVRVPGTALKPDAVTGQDGAKATASCLAGF